MSNLNLIFRNHRVFLEIKMNKNGQIFEELEIRESMTN